MIFPGTTNGISRKDAFLQVNFYGHLQVFTQTISIVRVDASYWKQGTAMPMKLSCWPNELDNLIGLVNVKTTVHNSNEFIQYY